MAGSEAAEDNRFLPQACPIDGVTYPLKVVYCGVCSLPLEFCEYTPSPDKCKEWLQKNLPTEFDKLSVSADAASGEAAEGDGEEKKKRQTRGGRGAVKPKKKATEPQTVCLSTAMKGKKKSVTIVTGLASYGINLKEASKFFGARFACGSSITGEDEIQIQGNVKLDLWDLIPEKWPQIDEDNMDDLGDKKA